MTAKKKFNFKAPLEVFAKSIVQPMMYLSVAGILLIVGIILTNKTICAMIPVLGSGPFQLVGAVVYQSLMFIINNLSILFCVGIAGAMAKKNKGHASLIALMSFFLFLQAMGKAPGQYLPETSVVICPLYPFDPELPVICPLWLSLLEHHHGAD